MATNAYLDSDHPPAAAEAAEQEDGDKCNLFRCFCCWRKYCRPHVPRFPPGRDVDDTRAPSDASDHPTSTWSVLVGCISAMVPFHNLRLHRFRVAASGRVIGRTDDALEPVLAVSPGDGTTFISGATAALDPGGRRLLYGCCMHSPGFDGAIIRSAADLPPADAQPQLPHRAFAVDLDTESLLSPPPPPLPFFNDGTYYTVSAHGKLWAPSVVDVEGGLSVRLVMHRLELGVGDDRDTWGEVASVDMPKSLNYYYLDGYAVIGDRFILLSLSDSTFFCFDCATGGTLTPVSKSSSKYYIPICGKAVHVHLGGDGDGDDMVVYFLRLATLFAYRLWEDEEGKLSIAPPVEVERLWPYRHEEGYGSVVHLSGRMLCAVWMNMNLPCGCAQRHALITTLLVRGDGDGDDGGSVEVLHSTCRRVDMLRSKAVPRYKSCDVMCFLQEYPDRAGSQVDDVDPSTMPIGGSSPTMMAQQEVGEEITDDMPNCCRAFLSGGVPILKECTSVVTKPDFYFICQAHDHSHVYQISVTARGKLTCHEQLLKPQLSLDTTTLGECGLEDDPPSWHFVQQGPNKLYVIPSAPGQNHYEVDVSSKLCSVIEMERPQDGVCFSVVSRAGQHIVALGNTLQDVYVLNEPALKWLPLATMTSSLSDSVDLTRKVNISGFVDVVHDNILVVSDVDVVGCFLLDLRKKEWFAVKPPSGIWLQSVKGLLCGRCLFAEGFMYVCTRKGFRAFELLEEDTCYTLGWPISIEFPYAEFLDRKLVSFDLICKEENPSSMVLCVVQGCFANVPFTSCHRLVATTVQVKLQEMAKGRKAPVRIDHIDISDSRVDHEGWIWTSHAFSL